MIKTVNIFTIHKSLGMIHIRRPWKLANFQEPPLPLSIYVQNSSTPLTLEVQFQTKPPLQLINNQLKENIIQVWLLYVIRFFLQVGFHAFIFSINSLILSGFPLTSFRLAAASLSAFSWLYTLLACAVVQKFHEMSFIYNYLHF